MSEPLIQPALQTPPAWEDLRIECVTFDPAGLPKRRRLVSFMAMLQPFSTRSEVTRRRALGQEQTQI